MNFVKDVLLRHWGIKLTSVLLAFLLWLAVRGEPPAERVITVPLEIILSPDMQISGERPGTVDVTLRGSASSMWFGQPFPSCRIDLGQKEEGRHEISLTPADVRVPRAAGLEVVSVRPARVKLTLEKIISREVPVRVIRGDPALDLEVYGVIVEPARITITGPRSHVQQIRDVPTENISLSGQRESIQMDARLDNSDSTVHLSPPGPVQVSIQLGGRRQLQTVTGVTVVPNDASITVIPPRLTLRILVPVSLGTRLSAADFEATVSAASLEPSQKAIQVKPVVKPRGSPAPGIAIMEVRPPEVTIRRESIN